MTDISLYENMCFQSEDRYSVINSLGNKHSWITFYFFLWFPMKIDTYLTSCTVRSHNFRPPACESKHFRLSLIFSPVCEYRVLLVHVLFIFIPKWPLTVFKWSRSPVFTKNKQAVQLSTYVFAAHDIPVHWGIRLFVSRVSTSRVQSIWLRGVMVLLR
jgi:hypothetical protein